jgi:hypothetical protein
MNATNLAQWGISALIVMIYALNRFETPSPARATTTFVRYSIARFCYVLSMLMLFILLGGGLTESAGILALVTQGGTPPTNQNLPGPLYAALLLTSVLPNLPVLSKIDEWIKQEFQRMGNIPFEVLQLSARLQQTPLELNVNLYPSFRDDLRDAGIDEQWFHLPPNTFAARWSRIAALRLSLSTWPELRGYARYIAERQQLRADIEERYKALSASIDETGVLTATGATSTSIASTLAKQIKKEMIELNKRLCDFVAGGVLQCEWARGDREARLRATGFVSIVELRNALGANEVLLVGAIVFVAMNAVVLVFHNYVPNVSLAQGLYMAAMVSIIYAVAIVIALYPKTIWRAADVHYTRTRPYGAYAMAGLVAAVVAFFIAVAFKYLFVSPDEFIAPDHFVTVLAGTARKWPWMLMTFGATVSIAWTADDYATSPDPEPVWLRWTEASALAAIFCGLQWYVGELLVGQGFKEFHDKPLQFLLTSAIVGGCIGFLVPYLYREGNATRTAPEAKQATQSAAAEPTQALRASDPSR